MAKNPPSEKAKELIDANLRRVFEEAAKEDLPDRFHDLLAQLKETKPQQDRGSGQ